MMDLSIHGVTGIEVSRRQRGDNDSRWREVTVRTHDGQDLVLVCFGDSLNFRTPTEREEEEDNG
jgi:hypothetical protein